MAVTAQQLIDGFRRRHNREPDRSEREQILTAAFVSKYNRQPSPEQKAAFRRAAAAAFAAAPPRPSPAPRPSPGGIRRDRGKRPEPAGRKLYAGGKFSDTMDALSTPNRAVMAGLGALFNPAGGGYLDRYRNPDTSYGALLREANPRLKETTAGRVASGALGLVGDVMLDPTTYVGTGAAKAAVKAARPVTRPVAKAAAKTKAGKAAAAVAGNVKARAAARDAAAKIIREERRAVGAAAIKASKAAQDVKDTAAAAAKRSAKGTPKDVRAGVGRVLDTGYDAARQAKAAEAARQAQAVKAARKTLVIPARTKAARVEGKLAATRQDALAIDTLAVRMQKTVAAGRKRLSELESARQALRERLGGWNARNLGKNVGDNDASRRLAKQYLDTSDKLPEMDRAIEALNEQIAQQHEAIAALKVGGKNLAEGTSTPGRASIEKWLEAHNVKTVAGEDLAMALDRLEMMRMLRQEAAEDPSSLQSILRQITGGTAKGNPYYSVTPSGRAGNRKVSVFSIENLSDAERKAFRDFMEQYGGHKSRAYTTVTSRIANPDKPQILRGSAPEEFDRFYPAADVRDAVRSWRAAQRSEMTGVQAKVSAATKEYRAARKALSAAKTPFEEAKAWDRAMRAVMAEEREEALEAVARLEKTRDKALSAYNEVVVESQGLARALNTQAKGGRLGLTPKALKDLNDALAAHEDVVRKMARARGAVSASITAANRSVSEAGRLAARAAKMEPVVAARKQAAADARHALTDPAAQAARRQAVAAAGDTAKAPAMDAAIDAVRQDLGLTPEGEGLFRGLVQQMQAAGDQSGAALEAAGILKPGTAAANRGVYAKRLYEQRANPDAFLESLRQDPIGYLREEARQAGGFRGGGSNPLTRPAHHRKDMGFDVREDLGQIEDILPRFLRGESEATAAVARKGLLEDFGARFGMTPAPQEAAQAVRDAPGGTLGQIAEYLNLTPNRVVQVPDVAKYGPLRGQYVPHEALRTLDRHIAPARLSSSNPLMDAGLRLYGGALGAWKAAKVPFNPPTRIANRVSNWARAYSEEGIDPVTFMRQARIGADALRGEGRLSSGLHGLQRALGGEVPRPDITPLHQLATETDPVFHSGLMGSGYRDALQEALGQEPKGLFGALRRGLDYVGHGYGKAEATDKLGLFDLFLKQGKTPEEAAEAVRRILFDYAEAPHLANVLGDTGLMPFARYPFLAAPAEARAFVTRPGRYTTAAHGLNEAQQAWDDGSRGYEEQTMHGFMRDNAMVRLPWRDAAGRSQYLDISRYLPAGIMLDAGETAKGLNPLRGNPFANLLHEATSGRETFTGRDFADFDLPLRYRMPAMGAHAVESMLPSTAPGGIYWNQMARALRGEADGEGVPLSVPRAALRYGTGATIRPVTTDRNIELREMELDRTFRALDREAARRERRGTLSEGFLEAMARMQEAAEREHERAVTGTQ